MSKVAFLTTIFPINETYIDDFFHSLISQTDSDFDLIILNDGYSELNALKAKYSDLNIIELETANNIALNRERLIKYAKDNSYSFALFGDIDDYFDNNRIAVSKSLLESYDIVVNDLTIFSSKKLQFEKYFSNRITNNTEITLDFILDKNIFGLSNTAINLDNIRRQEIMFSPKLIAVDWYFFSNLLLQSKRAIFTCDTVTHYRQHGSNTVGMGSVTLESINNILKVRHIHYMHMKSKADIYNELLIDNENLSNLVKSKKNRSKIVTINNQIIPYQLWWELIGLGIHNEINK
jgi:hypothetical protein